MIRLRGEGLGVVVHTFSENDLLYYRGTMKRIVAASQEAGLRVWLDPWGLGGVFGGEAFSDAALKEADWAQISSTGNRLPACCPSHPGFRNFLTEWIGAGLETGARVFATLKNRRIEELNEHARLLAFDYAFKQTFGASRNDPAIGIIASPPPPRARAPPARASPP